MKTVYQAQIERLTKRPSQITKEWMQSIGLFKFIPNTSCCITMIREGDPQCVWTPLAKAIQADIRLPVNEREIKPEHLPIFAEWQCQANLEEGE